MRGSGWLCGVMGMAAVALSACSSGDTEEACTRNSQCPPGFSCQSGRCEVVCDDNSDCAGGLVCVDGACVQPVADAGPDVDAGDVTQEPDVQGDPIGVGPDGQPMFGAIAGASCAVEADCRPGLVCGGENTCTPAADGAAGEACTISGECAAGLACGALARCEPSAGSTEGGPCSPLQPSACGPGLRCEPAGLAGVCQPEGEGDLGADCQSDGECLAPLACSSAGACAIPAFGGITRFQGVTCQDPGGPFRVLFEVPEGEGDELPDFFRLPYPNDIRRTEAGIDLTGFPIPPPGALGSDIVGAALDALETSGRGFSPLPTVFFRLSQAFDFDTVSGGGDSPSLFFVNVDPDSAGRGSGPGFSWYVTTGGGKYICPNYIAVRPGWHGGLEPATTYAVYLTSGVLSEGGQAAVADEDFAALMGDSEPSEPHLAQAWAVYQPLRDYLDGEGVARDSVAAAAVFTTMDPVAEIGPLREAIRGRVTRPELEDLTLCQDGAVSPCDDGAERVCLDEQAGIVQIHATYRAPIYQAGERPYLTAEQGGALGLDEDGAPESQALEDICLSLSLPDAEVPADGWPVVIFAPGTGGDFLTHIRNGTAAELADIDLGGGETAQFASVSIDGVQHGPRRGTSELDPELLFFNVANPRAAIGNVQQGAADLFYLTWLLEEVSLEAGESPTGEAIRFDPDEIHFFGHSQGATVGAPFVAFEPHVRSAVFSGSGAGLILALLNKQSPYPIRDIVTFLVDDGQLSDMHPLLSLLQQLVDPADPVHFAPLFHRRLPAGRTEATHVFVSYGLGDTYSPDPTIEVFGSQAGVQLAIPTLRDVAALTDVTLPATGNRSAGGQAVTAVMVTYQPEAGEDGHCVIFRDERAIRQSMGFLGTALRNGVPTVAP